MQPDAALALAIGAVQRTGERLCNWRQQHRFAFRSEGHTIKAEADSMANDCLKAGLEASGFPVLSEEEPQAFTLPRPSRYWLIDPLDGTASFVGGFMGFVTQAAFMDEGRPLAAAVLAPALDLLYTATAGGGATLNGKACKVASESAGIRLIDNYPEPRGFAARVHAGLHCTEYIESGSIGLKICRVADGTADIFIKDVPVRDWDLAAPHLVLTEAGGHCRQLDGSDFTYLGQPEHPGLVAASCAGVLDDFMQWQRGAQP